MGIGPTSLAWQASVIPLYDTRILRTLISIYRDFAFVNSYRYLPTDVVLEYMLHHVHPIV